MRPIITLLMALSVKSLSLMAQTQDHTPQNYPQVKIDVEHLPDLNTPRAGHHTLYIDGELMVFGGHTSGFVPTPTAERLTPEGWQQMDMTYCHDFATAIRLSSGDVLLAGGMDEPLGIGQTFPVEWYHHSEQRFEGFGCLDNKRASADALELDDGRVIISGNWYRDDDIEYYDGKPQLHHLKPTSVNRSIPYIFKTAPDNAMIFSGHDIHADYFNPIIVDQLEGDPFELTLPNNHRVVRMLTDRQSSDYFIGDEQAGNYSYLFLASAPDNSPILMRTHGTDFSVLPTQHPLPTVGVDADSIMYVASLVIDRGRQRAYLIACSHTCRRYVVQVEYADTTSGRACPVTLYYTEPLDSTLMTDAYPVLTPDGNIVVVGGTTGSNFYPKREAFILKVVATAADDAESGTGSTWLIFCIVALIAVGALGVYFMNRNRRTKIQPVTISDASLADESAEQTEDEKAPIDTEHDYTELMNHIIDIIETQRLYLNNELKIQDIAAMTNTNIRYVSACFNELQHCSFSQFINRYRVQHAQQVMRSQPDTKMLTIALDSGFANETTFFRVFKQVTGMTPRQWLAQAAE